MKLKLDKLLQTIGVCQSEDIEINGIEADSRKVKPGSLFVAISGHESDGHAFIHSAIEKGAAAIIGENTIAEELPVPYYRVANSRESLSKMANLYYQMPHQKHKMVGITGTNGKTTTAYMLHHILTHNGKTAAMLGTVENILNGARHESNLTTPDAISLQKMIHDSKDEFIIMEVSSHGLDQYRVAGPMLDVALFTNLSHDHLDYHKNMENYYQAKKKIFGCLKSRGKGIVGVNTSWGERMFEELSSEFIPVLPFGHGDKVKPNFLLSAVPSPKAAFTVADEGKEYTVRMKIRGRHNIFNALGSYLCARELGFSPKETISGLESFHGAPGRFEEIHFPNGAKAIIDYAHTPDGFDHALNTAKDYVENRLFHIFGFRGKRDASKRKDMVEISRSLTDAVFLTLDDLNGMEKEEMIEALKELSRPYPNVTVIVDRTEAIAQTASLLKKGDGMIVTGKGPENYKDEYLYRTRSDKETILKVLADINNRMNT